MADQTFAGTLEEAEHLLREHGAYGWLLEAPEAYNFNAPTITAHMAATGVETTERTVMDWIKATPHATLHGRLGWYATRNDLILLFAGRIKGRKLA